MAEERGPQANMDDESLMSDEALGIDNGSVPSSEDDPSVQSSPTSGENVPEAKVDFGGLPFKSVEDLVKGHKSLQDGYRQSREDVWNLQQQVQALIGKINMPSAAPSKDEPFDTPRFLEQFITGPDKAISQIAGKGIEAKLKEMEETRFAPLQQQLQQLQTERAIDRFMGEHPEITSEDEDALLEIMKTTPWLNKMQGTVPEKLDAALSVLLRKEPARFSARSASSNGARGLNAMKEAASAVGGKAGTRAKAPKDEFDEVLDQDAGSRALWR